jgi:ADP-ribose pyrophosphatase YjhB (NUDIX family)
VFQAGAFATILNEQGEILLCHRRDVDLWNAPGGRVEPGEAPWDAVVREIREETALDAEVVGLASVSWKPRQNEILFQFVCRITGGVLAVTEESDDFGYFTLDALPARLSPAFRARLLDWSQTQHPTILRTDDGPSTRELLDQGYTW